MSEDRLKTDAVGRPLPSYDEWFAGATDPVQAFLDRAEKRIAQGKGLPFKASFGMLVIEWLRRLLEGKEDE